MSAGQPFVARQAEIRAARQLVGRLARGRGGVLLIVGEAGVGKTRLLAEACRLAAKAGFPVARTTALPLGTQLPGDVVGDLLAELRRSGRIRTSRLSAGAAAFRALTSRLAQGAAAGPLCLAVDDLHWSDETSIDLLRYGITRLADLPIGWLLAARQDGAAGRLVHDLARRGLARRADLRPFSAAETESLLRAHLRDAGLASVSSVLHQRTGGNLLLLTEVIRASLRPGPPSDASDLAGLVPGSVSDWLAGRLAMLPGEDGELLAWAALLPEPVQLRWLAALCLTPDEPAIRAGVARLTAERILDDDEDGIRFRHALIRDAAAQRLSPGEHRRRCATAADLLAAEPSQVRAPLLAAAGRADEAARAYLLLADEALMRAGGQNAGRLYLQAESLARRARAVGVHQDALAGRVLALLHAGHPDEARGLAGDLLSELRPPGDDTRRLLFLTRYALAIEDHMSDLGEAMRAISEASALIDSASGRPLVEALLARAFVLTMAGNPVDATRDAERAAEIARDLGDPVVEVKSLNRLGLAVGRTGAASKGMDILRRALALAESAGLAGEVALACLNLSYLAELCGDPHGVHDWALRGLAGSGLSANCEALLRSNAGGALMSLGDLDGALAYEVSGRALAAAIGHLAEDRITLTECHVLALRGDLAQARRALERIRFVPESLDHHRQLEVLAIVDEEEGRFSAALAGYRVGARGPDDPSSAWCLAGAARTAAHLGQLGVARDAAGKLDQMAGRWPAAGWLGTASSGWLALAAGHRAKAAVRFADAAAASSEEFEAARLRLAAGLASGDKQQIKGAHDAFVRMGAAVAGQRARAAARRAGIQLSPAGGRRIMLTSRELEVALLVASGKTNAGIAGVLFVSARTIEHHVANILVKLGFRSRVEIAAQVAAGLLPGLGSGKAPLEQSPG